VKQSKVVDQANRVSLSAVQTGSAQYDSKVEHDRDSDENIETPSKSLEGWLRNPGFVLLSLSLLTFVLYVGTLSFQFVWDDKPQIVNNPLIRTWAAVPRAFVSDLWYHATPNQLYYRPLFTTWSTLNYSLFELKPWGWHLGAIVAHILAVIAVFVLARKLALEYWTAALSALLFAVHPVHIECVAWVSAASDSLVTFFFALSFASFLNSRNAKGGNWLSWRVVSLFLLACALLTKEMGVTLCLMVAIYVWLFPRPGTSSKLVQAITAALPFGIVTFAYVLLRRFALHHVAGTFDRAHGVSDMVLTWPLVLSRYLRILVLPLRLTGLYYDPYVQSAASARFWLPVIVLAAVAAGIWYWARRTADRIVAFAGLWMVVTLIPALYLRNFSNGDFVRDRYVYLPSIGFVILVAKLIQLLPALKSVSSTAVQTVVTSVLVLAYCVGTYAQQVYWGSELLVFARGNALYPNSPYAAVGFAKELSRRGSYDRAIRLMTAAIREKPDLVPAYFFLAEAYTKAGDKEKARAALEKYIQILPAAQVSEISQIDVAGIYGQLGDYDRALSLCSQVLQTEPDLYSALYNCGNINLMAGHYTAAEKLLTLAVRQAPQEAAPSYFLGRVFLQTNRPSEAEASFRKAVALDPNVYDYHYWYAQVLTTRGDIPDARRELLAAIAVKSDGAEAKAALAALPEAP
jgi:protein O-mannosyl-transferase